VVDISLPSHRSVQVNGSVPADDDGEELRVILSLSDRSVSISSGHTELGAWPVWSVEITQINDEMYEVAADGDRVTFVPDEPAQLGRLGIGNPPPSPDRAPPPRRATAAARAALERIRSRHEAPEPKRVPEARRASQPARATEPKRVTDPNRAAEPKRAAAAIRPDEQRAPGPMGGVARRAWLFAIDRARAFDLLGLDRVPVTKKMRRDPHHQHTWDHRVAAGITRHICTACGRVRLSG
jgi:hypothetical protein